MLAILAATPVSAGGDAEIRFIVSPERHVAVLNAGDVRRIFLGLTTRWPDGHRIELCVRSPRSPEGKVFLSKIIHRSAIDYAQWWIGAIFRGDAAVAPQVFDGDEEMMRSVAANRYAIGFIASEHVREDVRVVVVRYPPAR